MSNELSSAAICYGLYDENNIIGFCAVLHQPHERIKNLKRCSRIVILPDYQGIGLGTKFLNAIAEHYHNLHYEFSIVTSAKNMIHALRKSNKWTMIRYSANKHTKCKTKKSLSFAPSIRTNCKTASFMYKGR